MKKHEGFEFKKVWPGLRVGCDPADNWSASCDEADSYSYMTMRDEDGFVRALVVASSEQFPNMLEQDEVTERYAKLFADAPELLQQRNDLLDALKSTIGAFESALSSVRCSIEALGGNCPEVESMMNLSPAITAARKAIEAVEGKVDQ